jgi:hypothetical protein
LAIKQSRKRVSEKQAKLTQNASDNQANVGKYQADLASIALATVANPVRNSWID